MAPAHLTPTPTSTPSRGNQPVLPAEGETAKINRSIRGRFLANLPPLSNWSGAPASAAISSPNAEAPKASPSSSLFRWPSSGRSSTNGGAQPAAPRTTSRTLFGRGPSLPPAPRRPTLPGARGGFRQGAQQQPPPKVAYQPAENFQDTFEKSREKLGDDICHLPPRPLEAVPPRRGSADQASRSSSRRRPSTSIRRVSHVPAAEVMRAARQSGTQKSEPTPVVPDVDVTICKLTAWPKVDSVGSLATMAPSQVAPSEVSMSASNSWTNSVEEPSPRSFQVELGNFVPKRVTKAEAFRAKLLQQHGELDIPPLRVKLQHR